MRAFLALLLCLWFVPLWAEDTPVYKRVRPDGTVEFSDEPTPGGQLIEVPELPTYTPRPLPPPTPKPRTEAPPAPVVKYDRLQVAEPAADSTVFFDEQGTPVAVSINPPLQPGHVIAIYLDGQPAARGQGPRFTLKDVFRGTHTLTAVVEDGKGATLLRSAPVTFYLRQHTVRP